MRRSDWSSDVCSSDLFETSMRAFVRSAFISSVSTSLPSRRSLGGLSQGGETRGGRNLRPWDVSRAWVVSEAEVDRKGGVLGKGVSVSVDIGGRRIMKKKTKD